MSDYSNSPLLTYWVAIAALMLLVLACQMCEVSSDMKRIAGKAACK